MLLDDEFLCTGLLRRMSFADGRFGLFSFYLSVFGGGLARSTIEVRRHFSSEVFLAILGSEFASDENDSDIKCCSIR